MKHLITILCTLCVCCDSTIPAINPNIIIFLADDLGYADLGVNGRQDISTPNLDSIEKNRVRVTGG